MLYRISVTERGLTGIANIFRSRLSRLDDLLEAGTVPLMDERLKKIFLLDEPKASSIKNLSGASSLNDLSCNFSA